MTHPVAVVRARDVDGLSLVADRVHDRLFETGDIAFDEAAALLTIPFAQEQEERADVTRRSFLTRRPLRWEIPLVAATLEVRAVEELVIRDEAEIGCQQLNDVMYDAVSRTVVVTADVPLTVEAKVRELDVAVVETDRPIGRRTYHSFLVVGESSNSRIDAYPEPRR